MSTNHEKRHYLSVDGDCIRTFIHLDSNDLPLIVQCLRDEHRRMASSTDSQCWALCVEREEQCERLVSQILTAGFDTTERVELRLMEVKS